jgi:DNA-directed RNA polymerase specialized sigma24 family protein
MGKKGNFCKINPSCDNYGPEGFGNDNCLSCKAMERKVSAGNHTQQFFTMDSEMIENVQDDKKITSIFTCLAKLDPQKRMIFEDYEFTNMSMNKIAKDRGLSRQQVYTTIRSVRHDCKKMLGLSTVF